MRINPELRLPGADTPLVRQLTSEWRSMATQLNQMSEGVAASRTNAMAAPPTGTAVNYAVGDIIQNIAPSVLGTAGSRYVIQGWQCVAAGSPGTWVQMRYLTGT